LTHLEQQLVSAIIPVRNGRDTITAAVRSALEQTHPRVEVIVVDDASSDDTRDIVAALDDPRVRILHLETNVGTGLARNAGIAAASGEWIAMLDADDRWAARRLEILLPLASGLAEPIVLADNIMHCFTVNGELQPWRAQWDRSSIPFRSGTAILDTADYIGLVPLLAKPVIPRRVLLETGVAHTARRFCEDTEFLIRLLKTGIRMLVTEEPLYYYRRARGSRSDDPERATRMREMFEDFLREPGFSERERRQIGRRIRLLMREERYHPFLFDLKAGRWGRAVGRCLRDPRLLAEFLRRLPESLRFRMRVRLSGGEAR
jgi:succinoglycan biosynthesis protein ExoO